MDYKAGSRPKGSVRTNVIGISVTTTMDLLGRTAEDGNLMRTLQERSTLMKKVTGSNDHDNDSSPH